jgi:hydrogenase small subunit
MTITRRNFLRYCTLSSAALGLNAAKIRLVEEALANPAAPSVLWIVGSACLGCSISFLNRISDKIDEPASVADVITGPINLVYHPALMAAAGDSAVAPLMQAYNRGNYVLIVEGAIPTAFDGHACGVWSYNGVEVTMQQAVQELTSRAAAVVSVGTCACFGGIPASGSNPTQAMGVRQYTGIPTINISGCPVNPDWVVWAVVQLLLGNSPELDADGRPAALYGTAYDGSPEAPYIHDKCPRNLGSHTIYATNFGENGHCLKDIGCRGPYTKARCKLAWCGIGGQNMPNPHPGHWCIGVNAPCHGCVEKTFPGPGSFSEPYEQVP